MFDAQIAALTALIVDLKPFITVAAGLGIFSTGVFFALGGSLREKAKENIFYIIIGIFMVAGCVQFATSIYESFSL